MPRPTGAGAQPLAISSRVVFLAALAIAALWVAMSFTYPLGWDQGLFAWMGNAIVQGGLPYRDAWDFKGPLVYYTFALAQWLFGVHLWSIRLLDVVLLLWSTLALRRAATALIDAESGRWAALLYFLWYGSHSYWHTAQPDGWTAMLLIVGLAPILARPAEARARAFLFAGICIGLVTLFKPTNALFLALPLAALMVSRQQRGAAVGIATVAGWILPIAVMAVWFASQGALDDLIAVHLQYAAVYAWLSPGDRLRGLAEYFLTARVTAVGLPLVMFGAIVLWRTHRAVAVLLAGWVVITTALVVTQNRFYAYHWLPMLPACVLLAAAAIQHIHAQMRTLATVLVAILLVHCLAPIVLEQSRFLAWRTGRIDRNAYYDAYGDMGHDLRAVDWLRHEGQPGKVVVFGWHSAVAWLSERETVSRFGYSLPLMMGAGLDVRAQYRAELLGAMASDPPRYILVGTQSEQILGAELALDDFPELAAFIRNNCQEVQRFGPITIYERLR